MATSRFWLDYTIWLPDPAQVATLQQASSLMQVYPYPATGAFRRVFGSGQVVNVSGFTLNGQQISTGEFLASPEFAASYYGATLQLTPTSRILPPMITSAWFGKNDANGHSFDLSVPHFHIERGGWFGINWLFGDDIFYYWRGTYQYAPPWDSVDGDGNPAPTPINPGTGTPIVTPDPTVPRLWIEGWENPLDGDEGSVSGNGGFSRDASRHVDGFGFRVSSQAVKKTHQPAESNTGYTTTSMWERFYFRIRILPSGTFNFWRITGATSGNAGLIAGITADSKLALYNCSAADVRTLIGTTPALEADRWYRADILYEYGTGAYADVYIDKSLVITSASFGSSGLGQAQDLASSNIGDIDSNVATLDPCLDFDDWIGAEVPANRNGLDWHNGSKVQRIIGNAFGPTNGTWAGDIRMTMNRSAVDVSATGMTSATPLDRLELDVDVEGLLRSQRGYVGVPAVLVSRHGRRVGGAGGHGKLGYTTNGGADVLATIIETGGNLWQSVMFRPTPGEFWPDLISMQLLFEKANDGDTGSLVALTATAEILGVWGPEDVADTNTDLPVAYAQRSRIHNAPYPESPWAQSLTAPISPVAVVSGTYIGTGAGKDLTFSFPVTWLFIRRVTTLAPGTHWWTTKIAGKNGHSELITPEAPVLVGNDPTYVGSASSADPEFRYRVRIAGGLTGVNNSGDTYQYIAFCDPGMRFCIAGCLLNNRDSIDAVTHLIDGGFTPEFGFFASDEPSGSNGNVGEWFKGVGHAAATVSPLNGAETANAATFGAATITTQSALHNVNAVQMPFIVFRHDDGSEDVGIPRVVRQFAYTGDGVAARTLSVNLGGMRPVWAMVVPHNAAAVFRDASHTTTTSSTMGLTSYTNVPANGITGGGIDQLSVAIALNALGVDYDVLIFPGGTTAGNGGFSVDGEFIPVAPDIAPGDQWDEEFPPWGFDDIVIPPVDQPEDLDSDLAEDCIDFTQKVGDRALSHIGISQRLVDLGTDNTVEAEMLRLHYTEDVLATLRDFPWAFATQYASVEDATLELVAGVDADDPANPDWIFSYRAPVDCVFVRRIVKAGVRRAYDSDPIKFRMMTDDEENGDLILTDQEDAVIEYTRRPPCAASRGDALFREALSFRLAAHLAPTLSRNKMTAAECMQMYRYQLALAKQASTNEGQPSKDGDASWIEDRN